MMHDLSGDCLRRLGFVILLVFVLTSYVAAKEPPEYLYPSLSFVEQEQERLEKLFSKLNLAHPPLKSTRDAYLSGDLRSACARLLEYYRSRGIPPGLLPDPLEGTDERIQIAKDALAGRYTVQDITGKPPRTAKGGLDWRYKGPRGEAEWAWLFNRHSVFRDLFVAAQLYPDDGYDKQIGILVDDWVHANPLPALMSFSPAWRALEAARRIEAPWVEVFFGLADFPAFSAEARLMLLSSVPDHAEYLREHHAFGGNHKITEMMALLLIALAWEEFKEAPRWQAYALEMLQEQLFAQSYPDGAHKELANHYQRVALMSFQRTLELLHAAGKEEALAQMRPRVEAMWNYFARIIKPIGWGPLNNDSDLEDNGWIIADHAMPFYKRQDWLWMISYTQKGSPPEGPPSYYFPWAGHAIMRENWLSESPAAFFDIGPYGSDHQHRDRLHLSLCLGRHDYLVDAGRYTYEPGSAREYYQGPRAHNVVLLNGEGTLPGPDTITAPMPVIRAEIGELYDVFEAEAPYPDDLARGRGSARHQRRVVYWKNGYKGSSWVVVDNLISFGSSHWETLWHWHPDCPVMLDGLTARSTFEERVNLAIIPVGFEPEVRIVRGLKEPEYQGWHSYLFNQQRPASVFIYSTRARGPREQVWFLVQVDEGERLPLVRREGDVLLVEWADGTRERMPINPPVILGQQASNSRGGSN